MVRSAANRVRIAPRERPAAHVQQGREGEEDHLHRQAERDQRPEVAPVDVVQDNAEEHGGRGDRDHPEGEAARAGTKGALHFHSDACGVPD
jgi:hypothetical protein